MRCTECDAAEVKERRGVTGVSAPVTVLHGPGPGCGRTGDNTLWEALQLPGTTLPCHSNIMPNTAITSQSPGIESRTELSMTRH